MRTSSLLLCVFVSSRAEWKVYLLHWRHNELNDVSNHQPHDCLHNRLFRRRLKKTSKLRATGLCAGNSPVTGEFPAQMASNAENVSVWWRHHVTLRWCVVEMIYSGRSRPIFSNGQSHGCWCLADARSWNIYSHDFDFISGTICVFSTRGVNTMKPWQNDWHFADGFFKCIFLNEDFLTSNVISWKYVPWRLIDIITWLCGFWREITSVLL